MKNGFLTCLSLGAYGRFMNGGYQIAAVLGIGRKCGLEPVFPLWRNTDHRDRFGSSEDIDVYKHFEHQLPSIPEGLNFTHRYVDWGYHDINLPPGNWDISGHFQSPAYFRDVIDTVQHYFRMKDEPPQNNYVGVHWRAGDYDDAAGWHPRMTMDYYAPAMAMFPGSKFLVFSDDIPAAKNLFGNSVEYSEGRDYIQDFKLMKRCRHFIIGNSSYSAMAAMLGEHPDKRVVAPRPWFGAAAGIDGEDIYGSDWQVINWQDERRAAA